MPRARTELSEGSAFALGQPEVYPDGDEQRAAGPEEAGIAAPVPRGRVELVAEENADGDAELGVSARTPWWED